MKKVLLVLLAVTGYYGLAQEKDPVLLDSVTIDTKTTIARKNSGKITTLITPEMLEQQKGSSVADIINQVAGIEINGNFSNDGQNLSYLVRGGNNRQVVIMVDGVQLNDPSQIANDFDLRLLSAASVESIEIMKGASSVLYGSGAATAVIDIRTKAPSEDRIAAQFVSTVGTNRATEDSAYNAAQFTNTAGVDGTLGKFNYDLDFSHRYTDGLSAVAAPEGQPLLESDVFNRFNSRLNLGYRINDKVKFSQFIAIDKFKGDFDNFDFTDANNRSITEQLRTGGHFEWKYKKGVYIFNDSYSWIEREVESSFPAKFDSRSYTFDTYLNHQLFNNFRVVLGLNGNFSSFESFTIPFGSTEFSEQLNRDDANFSIVDPYVNVFYVSNFGLNLNAGTRLNIHNIYGNNLVYNINPSYNFTISNFDFKVLGTFSTAYITPSLFQLYDPLYGNEELAPEDNTTIEAGIVIGQFKLFNISILYFDRNQENFVDFVTVDPENFIFQYQNIAEEFEASGIEIEANITPIETISISANYTNTQAADRFSIRVPEHKVNANLRYAVNDKTFIGTSFQYVGERTDLSFNPDTFESEEVSLEAYNLVGLSFNSKVSDRVTIFGELFNLLDEEYQELFGFQTRGRNVKLGFSLEFR